MNPIHWMRKSTLGKSVLTLTTVAAVGSLGVVSSGANLSESKAAAATSLKGGNLHLALSGNTLTFGGEGAANLAPGDAAETATVEVSNSGSIKSKMQLVASGANTVGACLRYSVAEGSNVLVSDRALGAGTVELPAATGSIWLKDEAHTYTVSVRSDASCETQDAAGNLSLTFNARQHNA